MVDFGPGTELRGKPRNVDAERSVLGSLLLDQSSISDVSQVLEAEDFWLPRHRIVFVAILEAFERGGHVDVLTVEEVLSRRGELVEVGGREELIGFLNGVVSAAGVGYHAEIVREKSIQRRLLEICEEIAEQAYRNSADPRELLDMAEERIFRIARMSAQQDIKSIEAVLQKTFERIDFFRSQRGELTGLPTGYTELDELTGGLQKGELVIVAARPSMGKTTLALNLGARVAQKGHGVLIFSLEMSAQQVISNMLCARAQINGQAMRRGRITDGEYDRLQQEAARLYDSPIHVDDGAGLSPATLRAKCRRHRQNQPLALVVVDYLQLMGGGHRVESRQQEIAQISRSLKGLARELEIPVIALSQLNRDVEGREDHRPRMSDLRECVTGDTPVCLTDGRRVPIRDLVGTKPSVWSVDRSGKVVVARSDRVWRVGVRPVLRVRLASGRSIRVTARHRLLSFSGWVRAGDLRTGQRLALARGIPAPTTPDRWNDQRIALLGQLIGDGSYLVHQPLRYTTSSERNADIVRQAACEEFGADVKRYSGRRSWFQLLISGNGNRWHPRGVGAWLRELGIFGQRSHQKRVPAAAFRLGDRQLALLTRHLWATDGSIWTRTSGRGAHRVFYATNSPGLASDVSALLLRLGIVSRTYIAKQGSYRPNHHVTVSGGVSQSRFLDAVGGFGPREPQAVVLRVALARTERGTNVDTVPMECFRKVKESMRRRGISQRVMASLRGTSYGGDAHFDFSPSRAVLAEYAEILDDDILRAHASSDLFWDEVVAVEPAGREEVFDLTVPGPANWLADGIVSHNSGAIEQDADVIMLLHREEYYKRTEENAGLAELIVAKQRNGPTGDVKLRFFAEYMRFENYAGRREPIA